MDLRFKHPYTLIATGPTGGGKTQFVLKFLKHLDALVDTPIVEIVWCYSEYQNSYETMHNPLVRFHHGLPDMKDFAPNSGARLIVIDDMMRESDGRIVDLFTKGSHHRGISIMFITQNLFHQGSGFREISLNTHYMVCFKNPRDNAQIRHLSRQVCPSNPRFVQDAFEDATSMPYGYLLLDFKQTTDNAYRIRTCIFPDDSINYVYIPKSKTYIKTNR